MTDDLCEACAKAGKQRCSRCHESRYCSQQCQARAWATHKLVCASAAEFQSLERPSSTSERTSYRRALLFEPEETKPRFAWLKSTLQTICIHGAEREEPELLQHLRFPTSHSYGANIDNFMIQTNPVLRRNLHHTIRVRFRDNFFSDGSLPNKAVQSFRPKHDWRGPLLCYAMKGVEDPLNESDDLDASDFPHIVQFLKTYGDERPLMVRRVTDEDLANMTPAELAGSILI